MSDNKEDLKKWLQLASMVGEEDVMNMVKGGYGPTIMQWRAYKYSGNAVAVPRVPERPKRKVKKEIPLWFNVDEDGKITVFQNRDIAMSEAHWNVVHGMVRGAGTFEIEE